MNIIVLVNSTYKITYFLNQEGDEYTKPSDKPSQTDVDVCSKTDLPTDRSIFKTLYRTRDK